MGTPTGLQRPTAGAGFTLVELVLTIALMLLLVSAAVFNFGSAQRGSQLDEGVGQLESLIRYARAQAASTGRLVRISFGDESAVGSTNATENATEVSGGIQVLWEPDSLGTPGQFERLREATPFTDRLNELVQFSPVLKTEPAGAIRGTVTGLGTVDPADAEPVTPLPADEGVAAKTLPAISFYPDGSSDSAELLLRSIDVEDQRQVHLTLVGLTGTVRRKWISPEAGATPAEEVESSPREANGVSPPPLAKPSSTP
jgi:type II secretory pathway pseudopilin PulG